LPAGRNDIPLRKVSQNGLVQSVVEESRIAVIQFPRFYQLPSKLEAADLKRKLP
jgi:hypothetical protein